MRIASALVIAFPLIGFSAGCAMSLHPLSDDRTSVSDKQLLGVWEEVEKNEGKDNDEQKPDRFRIDSKPNSKVAMLVTDLDSKDKMPPLTLLATILGERRYLSLGGHNEEKNRLEWLIAEYKITDQDSLQMRLFDPKRVRKEVEAGTIKGHVEERKEIDSDGKAQAKESATVLIEDSTDNLRKFLDRHPDQLFTPEWVRFKRLAPGGSTKSTGGR